MSEEEQKMSEKSNYDFLRKVNDTLSDFVKTIPFLSGILVFYLNVYRLLKLESYYSYFKIDTDLVSKSLRWNITDFFISISVAFCSAGIVYGLCLFLRDSFLRINHFSIAVKNTVGVDSCTISYLRQKLRNNIIRKAALLLIAFFFLLVIWNSIYGPFYDEKGNRYNFVHFLKIPVIPCGAFFGLLMVGLNIYSLFSSHLHSINHKNTDTPKKGSPEDIYSIIFSDGKKDDKFKEQQIAAITKDMKFHVPPLSKIHTYFVIIFLALFVGGICLGSALETGEKEAAEQREFLVTEDNKHVAIPVSDNRYALIEIREDGDKVILMVRKQAYHAINDFPCTWKVYKEAVRDM